MQINFWLYDKLSMKQLMILSFFFSLNAFAVSDQVDRSMYRQEYQQEKKQERKKKKKKKAKKREYQQRPSGKYQYQQKKKKQ